LQVVLPKLMAVPIPMAVVKTPLSHGMHLQVVLPIFQAVLTTAAADGTPYGLTSRYSKLDGGSDYGFLPYDMVQTE
jgi:hypothetical protein